MSWSFSAVGKPSGVLARARFQLNQQKCSEPEETIKNKVLNIIEASLLAMPEEQPVKVTANGSQSQSSVDQVTPIAVNQLQFTIEPLWGFVESYTETPGVQEAT